jgi:hypothetical protein
MQVPQVHLTPVQPLELQPQFYSVKSRVEALNQEIKVQKDPGKWIHTKDGLSWKNKMQGTIREVNEILKKLRGSNEQTLQVYTDFATEVVDLKQYAERVHKIPEKKNWLIKIWEFIFGRKKEAKVEINSGVLETFQKILCDARSKIFLNQLEQKKYLEQDEPQKILENRVPLLNGDADKSAFFRKTKKPHEFEYVVIEYDAKKHIRTRSGVVTITLGGIKWQKGPKVFSDFQKLAEELQIVSSLKTKEAVWACKKRKEELEKLLPEKPEQDIKQAFFNIQQSDEKFEEQVFTVRKDGDNFSLYVGSEKAQTISIDPLGKIKVNKELYDNVEAMKKAMALNTPLEGAVKKVADALEQKRIAKEKAKKEAEERQRLQQEAQERLKKEQAEAVIKANDAKFAENMNTLTTYCGVAKKAEDEAQKELRDWGKVLQDKALGMSCCVKINENKYILYVLEKPKQRAKLECTEYAVDVSAEKITVSKPSFSEKGLSLAEFAKTHPLLKQEEASKIQNQYTEAHTLLEKLNALYPCAKEKLTKDYVEKNLQNAISFLGERAEGSYLHWTPVGTDLHYFSYVHNGKIEHKIIDFEAKRGSYTLKNIEGGDRAGAQVVVKDKPEELFSEVHLQSQDIWQKAVKEVDKAKINLLATVGKHDIKTSEVAFDKLTAFFDGKSWKEKPHIGGYVIYPDPKTNSKLLLKYVDLQGAVQRLEIDLASSPGMYLVGKKLYKGFYDDQTRGEAGLQGVFNLQLTVENLQGIKQKCDQATKKALALPNYDNHVSTQDEASRTLTKLASPYKNAIHGAWLIRAAAPEEPPAAKKEANRNILWDLLSATINGLDSLLLGVPSQVKKLGRYGWESIQYILQSSGVMNLPEVLKISIQRFTKPPTQNEYPLGLQLSKDKQSLLFIWNEKEYPSLEAVVDAIHQSIKNAQNETWASKSELEQFQTQIKKIQDERMKTLVEDHLAYDTTFRSKKEADRDLGFISTSIHQAAYMFCPYRGDYPEKVQKQLSPTAPRLGTYLFTSVNKEGALKTHYVDIRSEVTVEGDKDGKPELIEKAAQFVLIEEDGTTTTFSTFSELVKSLQFNPEQDVYKARKQAYEAWMISQKKQIAKDLRESLKPLSQDALDAKSLLNVLSKPSYDGTEPWLAYKIACGFLIQEPGANAKSWSLLLSEQQALQQKNKTGQTPAEQAFAKLSLPMQLRVVRILYERESKKGEKGKIIAFSKFLPQIVNEEYFAEVQKNVLELFHKSYQDTDKSDDAQQKVFCQAIENYISDHAKPEVKDVVQPLLERK